MARDNKGRFIKEGAAAFRTYKESLEEMEKAGGKLDNLFQKLAERGAMMTEATEGTKDNFEDQLDIGKDLLKNTKNIFNVDLKGKDLSKQIAQAKADGNEEDELTLIALNEQIKKQRKLQDSGNEALKSAAKKRDTAKSFLSIIPGIGDSLGGALDKAGEIYEEGLGEDLAGSPKSFDAMKGAAKGAGLAIAAYIGKNLLSAMQDMGAGLGDMLSRPEFIFFGSESKAIADEFGNMDSSSMKIGFNMKMMAMFSGVSAENQAKIMGMMAATSDSSVEALHAQMKTYKQAGVPFRAIMEDVAGNTEFFAKYAKDGGANIFDAAKRAKELGVNLGDAASISESLLDFESSIEKEMEAQVLLGKNISLDRARQLAFSGDMVGMMDEVMEQMGGEAEFNKMNVIQRQALADSVGLSVEKMGALVRAEEQNATAAENSKGKYIMIAAIIGGIIGLIAGALIGSGIFAPIGAGVLTGAGVGLVGGVALGAGVGALVPMAEGGVAKGPVNALVGEAGPEAVVPLPAQGVKVNLEPLTVYMKKTNEILESLLSETRKLGVA
jgi:hypothetical protein